MHIAISFATTDEKLARLRDNSRRLGLRSLSIHQSHFDEDMFSARSLDYENVDMQKAVEHIAELQHFCRTQVMRMDFAIVRLEETFKFRIVYTFNAKPFIVER